MKSPRSDVNGTGQDENGGQGGGGMGPRYYRLPGRRVPWYLSIPITFVVIVALFLAAGKFHWLPGLPNPFGTKTVDRSQPAVLQSIQDMSRYDAAEGNFQIVVDVDKEAKYLPSVLLGKKTIYIAAGTVDSYVDLGKAQVAVSKDRKTATITLPPAQLASPALDVKNSYVFSQSRGLFDRIGSLFSSDSGQQQQLNVLAVQKIAAAAKSTQLTARAQTNTKAMLSGLLHSLGFQTVNVTYTKS